jgi:hypothetical protein
MDALVNERHVIGALPGAALIVSFCCAFPPHGTIRGVARSCNIGARLHAVGIL